MAIFNFTGGTKI